jgi:pimeloyl-ACP methyl ester carboxylesterase
MTARARTTRSRRAVQGARRGPVRPAALLGVIAAGVASVAGLAGIAAERAAERRDREDFPPPGRMVSVDGFRLHLDVHGPAGSRPTVILEAGLGSFSPNWHWVRLALSDHVRVVAYDRAGLGWSEPSPAPRDAATMATELRTALRTAGIEGPYVLAGHSFGGLVVRAFAHLHREEMAGLVLVDGSHPDQWARWPLPFADKLQLASLAVMTAAARVGLLRWANPFAAVSTGLPERQVAELEARFVVPRTAATEAAQMREWERTTRPFVNAQGTLGDLPLAVIGVGIQPLGAETLDALQLELPELSTNSVRRVIAEATHESLLGNRAHARQVADAILGVVDAAGGGRVESTWAARAERRRTA